MASRTRVTVASIFLVSLPCLTAAFWPAGGLTHATSCTADFGEMFTISSDASAPLTVSSAVVIDRDGAPAEVCDGLSLAMEVKPVSRNRADIILPVVNTSTLDVKATAAVRVGRNTTYIPVGLVRSGSTVTRSIPLKLHGGETKIDSRLIIGR